MNDTLIPSVPDFDDPLGLLRACHERMLAHCDMLEKLLPHLADKGFDEEARNAIGRIANYFGTSAVHHHQDEEQDLFPILNRQSLKLADMVYRLKQEHRELDDLWATVLQDLKKGPELATDEDAAGHFARFCQRCREHIEFENRELLEMARHILSSRQLQDMGDNMARRRGVKRP
ncbi:MAG TPA: hemerythrin domain-containing protein [Gammaproteobacteria bacterium]|nr:hemerythrin domain-containing protein [Gammaproteobacteria bacterium]